MLFISGGKLLHRPTLSNPPPPPPLRVKAQNVLFTSLQFDEGGLKLAWGEVVS